MKRSSFERSTLSSLPDKYVSESSILSSSSQLTTDNDHDDEETGGVFSDASLTSTEQGPNGASVAAAPSAKAKKSRFRSFRIKSLLLPGKKKKPAEDGVPGKEANVETAVAPPLQSANSQSSVATVSHQHQATASGGLSHDKPPRRHESILKKFTSMRKNRKQRKADAIKRHTPEGANLSQSEKSLCVQQQQQQQQQPELGADLEAGIQSEPLHDVGAGVGATSLTTTAPVVLEKGDQLHIVTRSVQKPNEPPHARVADQRVVGTRGTFNTEGGGGDDDLLPLGEAPPVPYNISEVEISKLLVESGGSARAHAHPHIVGKGAIKKTVTTTTQHKTRRDFYTRPAEQITAAIPAASDSEPSTTTMHRSGSIERGRRYPRPTSGAEEPAGIAVVQHLINEAAVQPQGSGNSVANTNLSGSIAADLTTTLGTAEATEALLSTPQTPATNAGAGRSDLRVGTNKQQQQQHHQPKMSSIESGKREHLYKILVIGELGTGKTSFIKRYVHQFFSQNYRATIGVDFALKVLNWDQNTIIRLQLWDIAGQERFGNMTRVYYKEAVGAFIVFDVTRSATFDAVVKWKQDLDSKVQLPNGNPIPCILLANKCDQPKQGLVSNAQKMDEYVKENGFAGWFETSAKENVNIEEAARALVNKILLNDKLINTDDVVDADKFGLNAATATGQPTKNKCAC